MEVIKAYISDYFRWWSIPHIGAQNVLEILVLAFVIYYILKWVRDTRAWTLMRGLFFVLLFYLIAQLLQMDVILFLIRNTINVGIIALLILFQPELRTALENLGRRNILPSITNLTGGSVHTRFSSRTVDELVRASFDLAKEKTGALMVLEKDIKLTEYEETGIEIDAAISSQLLINIFEKNTPLHDGAVILRGDRVTAATCYLPLSGNLNLPKALGTRHRAAVGISAITDSLTIVVSEETGMVSVARDGILRENLTRDDLRQELIEAQKAMQETQSGRRWGLFGKKHEEAEEEEDIFHEQD